MPNYRWTLTCEETLDTGVTCNITTKTLESDSESFTSCLALLPQLFNGAGFRCDLEDFEYKGVDFYRWSYEPEEAAAESLENDGTLAGFRFSSWDDVFSTKEAAGVSEYSPECRTRPTGATGTLSERLSHPANGVHWVNPPEVAGEAEARYWNGFRGNNPDDTNQTDPAAGFPLGNDWD